MYIIIPIYNNLIMSIFLYSNFSDQFFVLIIGLFAIDIKPTTTTSGFNIYVLAI